MNDAENGKQGFLSMLRCLVTMGFIAIPAGAQESPVGDPVAIEAASTTEAEAPELTEEAERRSSVA